MTGTGTGMDMVTVIDKGMVAVTMDHLQKTIAANG
jgi:rhamnose utilization protein RhaD (predicted bifunctional aldolase and dehydrogenase)